MKGLPEVIRCACRAGALCLLFYITPVPPAFAEILPSTNRIPWGLDIVGVPGGIPHRTKIFTNMTPGANDAAINYAISRCPSNQVIYLPAGNYYISNRIFLDN